MNARQERERERRKIRDAKKALFLEQARNGKDKRDSDRIRQFSATKHTHVIARCGNVGCRKCYV